MFTLSVSTDATDVSLKDQSGFRGTWPFKSATAVNSQTHHKQTVQAAGRLVCQTGSCRGWGGAAHDLPEKHNEKSN